LSTSLARYPGIDTLRGLSILLVVVHHVGIRLPLKKSVLADVLPARLLAALNYNGYESVCLFFVISGFLITIHALARHGSLAALPPGAFYARRFARIGPPLVLLVGVLSALHLAGVPYYTIDNPNQSLSRAILAAFGLHLNWYEGQTGYLPGGWDVLWSLSIEEVFYLAFPLLCLAVRREGLLGLGLAAFALTLPLTHGMIQDNEIWREKHYLPGMAAIATGIVAALIAHRTRVAPRVALALRIGGWAAILAVLGWGDVLWPVLGEGSLLVLTLGAAAAIVGIHADPTPRPWPGLGWLRFGGRLSYEIYLTHMFVVFAAVGAFGALGLEKRQGMWVYLPVLAACWALGLAMARWFSQPVEAALRARLLDRPKPGLSAGGACAG
jgi:peptidoglycan/LPS O-acetylase OafA/YrhL